MRSSSNDSMVHIRRSMSEAIAGTAVAEGHKLVMYLIYMAVCLGEEFDDGGAEGEDDGDEGEVELEVELLEVSEEEV
eukprot:gene32027-16552_t